MSESETVMGASAGAKHISVPAAGKSYASDAVVAAPPLAANSLWHSIRKAVSFPVMMGVLLVAVSLIGVRQRLPDPDTWWHIAVGEHILTSHTWPTTDPYSFTARGTDWIAYEWLGEVVMALAARAGGLPGLALLLIAFVGTLTALLYYYAYLRSGNAKAACVATALLLPVAGTVFTLRPQLLGYIFLLITLICLERFRQGHNRALWFLPPLFLIWANTHGTFTFGLAVIGLYYAGGLVSFQKGGLVAERWSREQRLQLLLIFLLCTLALLVTPYGTRLAAYPVQMATSQPVNIANIQEWQPITFNMALGKYFVGFLLLFFLSQVVFPSSYRLPEMGMLLFAIFAACVHVRFIMIFVMFLAPIVASILARWVPPYYPDKDRHILNLALIAFVVFGLAKYLPSKKELDKLVADHYPVAAVNYLRQHPHPTGMFNEYGYGGYLIWQLGPAHKVFIDGRADVYEYSGVLQDYVRIANLDRSALTLLRKYNIQSCLIGRKDAIATLLAASPDWKQVYSDDLSVLFVRTGGPDAPRTRTTDGGR